MTIRIIIVDIRTSSHIYSTKSYPQKEVKFGLHQVPVAYKFLYSVAASVLKGVKRRTIDFRKSERPYVQSYGNNRSTIFRFLLIGDGRDNKQSVQEMEIIH